jgi:hypothetical protein
MQRRLPSQARVRQPDGTDADPVPAAPAATEPRPAVSDSSTDAAIPSAAGGACTPNSRPAVTLSLILTQPPWHDGLRAADWLFHAKPHHAPGVAFFAWSRIDAGPGAGEREQLIGRLTHAIPLYLAEAVHYWSYYATSTYIDVAAGHGPMIYDTAVDGADMFETVPDAIAWLVTGQISGRVRNGSDPVTLSLTLWDCSRHEQVACASEVTALEGAGAVVQEMEGRLLRHLGMARDSAQDGFYLRPSTETMGAYLRVLGQSFMLWLLASGDLHERRLTNVRLMLECPLHLGLSGRGLEVPRLMYLSGLVKAMGDHSALLPEYQPRTLDLLSEAADDSPTARLAPLVWKIFGMRERIEQRLRDLPAHGEPSYRLWLERLLIDDAARPE